MDKNHLMDEEQRELLLIAREQVVRLTDMLMSAQARINVLQRAQPASSTEDDAS
jgi:hypothetical protein